jgi:hypothetical protein
MNSATTIALKKDGKNMAKTTKPKWLNTQFINTLRWEEDDGKMIEMNHSTFDLKRRKKQ